VYPILLQPAGAANRAMSFQRCGLKIAMHSGLMPNLSELFEYVCCCTVFPDFVSPLLVMVVTRDSTRTVQTLGVASPRGSL
jgi:hypothetical protein